MKKIIVFDPSPSDACAFYRGIGPFSMIPRKMGNVLIERAPQETSWTTLMGGDIFFMQRPYHPKHKRIAQLAKKQMPLWVDYDDLLLDLPQSNPAHTTYSKPEIQENIRWLLQNAAVVTVTTAELGASLSDFAEQYINYKVIPNAYNDYRLPTTLPEGIPQKVVLWRGSESHQGDLMAFLPELEDTIAHNPEWMFVFLGALPWQLKKQHENVCTIPGVDLFDYHPLIRSIRPTVTIVPLEDCQFNHAKSNIAWIESASAGALTVGPNWYNWQVPGVYTYDSDNFAQTVTDVLLPDSSRSDNKSDTLEQTWDYIRKHLFLSVVNEKRANLIREFTQ